MKNRIWTNRIIIIALLFTLIISLIGCGSKNFLTDTSKTDSVNVSYDTAESTATFSEVSMDYDESKAVENQASTVTGGTSDNQDILANQKIIQTNYITMETTDFDNITTDVENLINEYLGYIESSQIIGHSINNYSKYNTRNASYTFRVPAKDYESFINDLNSLGNVVNERGGIENVTMQYYDLDARINSLKVEEKRLLEIVEEGAELSQVLEVENHLADVRYQIETYTAQLKNLGNKVDYGTVYLELREVIKESVDSKPPITVAERISSGFSGSIKEIKDMFVNLFVSIITASPYLVFWVIIILLIFLIIKGVNKRNRKKHDKIIEQTQEKKE